MVEYAIANPVKAFLADTCVTISRLVREKHWLAKTWFSGHESAIAKKYVKSIEKRSRLSLSTVLARALLTPQANSEFPDSVPEEFFDENFLNIYAIELKKCLDRDAAYAPPALPSFVPSHVVEEQHRVFEEKFQEQYDKVLAPLHQFCDKISNRGLPSIENVSKLMGTENSEKYRELLEEISENPDSLIDVDECLQKPKQWTKSQIEMAVNDVFLYHQLLFKPPHEAAGELLRAPKKRKRAQTENVLFWRIRPHEKEKWIGSLPQQVYQEYVLADAVLKNAVKECGFRSMCKHFHLRHISEKGIQEFEENTKNILRLSSIEHRAELVQYCNDLLQA